MTAKYLICMLLFVSPVWAFEDLEYQIEQGQPIEYDVHNEIKQAYLKQKLHINTSSADELAELSILSSKQIASFLNYRRRLGKLISIFELQAIPFWDDKTIRSILPYIRVGEKEVVAPFKKQLYKGRHLLTFRYKQEIENKGTYQKNEYEGGAPYLLIKYAYKYGKHLSYGLTLEKDRGEAIFRKSNKHGFDFYSGYFLIRNRGVFKHIVIGDYSLNIGQGLVSWQAYTQGKTLDITGLPKHGAIIRPHQSTREYNFMRGAAAEVQYKRFKFTFIVSYRRIDAATRVEERKLVSRQVRRTGLHRTSLEVKGEQNIEKWTTGLVLQYIGRKGQLGAHVLYAHLNKPIISQKTIVNPFDFKGQQLINVGVDYKYSYKNIYLYGESSISHSGGLATLNGLLIRASKRFDLSILARYFDKKHHTLYANSIGALSDVKNEYGLLIGINLSRKKWRWKALMDVYAHPWLQSRMFRPTAGFEAMNKVSFFALSKKWNLSILYRIRMREKKIVGKQGRYIEHQIRLNTKFIPFSNWTFRNRVAIHLYKSFPERLRVGFLAYQDIRFHPVNFPLHFSARVTAFYIPFSSVRMYTQEHDLLHDFSAPSFSQSGYRYYVMMRLKIKKTASIWFRCAQTFLTRSILFKPRSIGQIQHIPKTQFKLQLSLAF